MLQRQNIYETSLDVIAAKAEERQEENDHFLRSLKHADSSALDKLVHAVYGQVSAGIDCTECGNCCSKLVINITEDEVVMLAAHLEMPVADTKERYIEESLQGNCYINTMPCHFLADKKCTIYTARFTECRDFPHLHKPGFKDRLPNTLMYYGTCPIIYNVVQEVKAATGFLVNEVG